MALFGSGIPKEIKKFQKQLSKDPDNARLHVKIGDLWLKENKKDDAIESYRKALDCYVKDGYPLKAIAVTKIILKIDPDMGDLQELLGDLYRKAGFSDDPGSTQPVDAQKIKDAAKEELGMEFPSDVPVDAPSDPPMEIELQELPAEQVMPEEFGNVQIETEAPVEQVQQPGPKPVKTPLFSDLNEAEFIQVVQKLRQSIVEKKDFVCREGDEGDSIYIIVSGRVRVIKTDSDGNEIVLTKLGEGEFFGEFGYFLNAKRTASVMAETETELLEIVKDEFDELIMDFPNMADVLDELFRERMMDNIMALSPLFSKFNSNERKDIRDRFSLKLVHEGEYIVTQGELSNSLFIIKDGVVDVVIEQEGEESQVVTSMSQGDFFGEVSAITGVPRTASVVARTDTEVMELTKDAFDETLMDYPKMVDILQEYARERVDDILIYFEFISKADEIREGLI